ARLSSLLCHSFRQLDPTMRRPRPLVSSWPNKRPLAQENSLVTSSRRILVIDDNRDIHQDFQKIFRALKEEPTGFDQLETALFGSEVVKPGGRNSALVGVTLDSAYQGEEGVQMAIQAALSGQPYLLAFVD